MRWRQFLTPVQSMNAVEARSFLEGKTPQEVIVLDVRQPGEYEEGHIPGARLIPMAILTDSLDDIDPARPVLVYCAIGGRSRIAAQTLAGKGYDHVINLSGGFKAWNGQTAYGAEEAGVEIFAELDSVESILATAYSLEEGLRDFYLRMLERVQDEKIKSVFRLLADIEIKHKDRLFAEYTRITGKDDRGTFECQFVTPLMEGGMTTEEYMDRFKPDFDSPVDVISLAMSIEAQALDLYIRSAVWTQNDENRVLLEQIASEEKTHLERLGQLLDELIGGGVPAPH
ncbi:MAG: sulfurtransferase [Desulfomicrobium sp.]|nr:sulfurtransferase [Pseudomonadota bacterium]MBV1711901.1 sulfurtransferase [Desulfomicrobium sp.]MBU4571078.1 sulfurtransferase [Pseudomonadota bacterium]MBU4593707.1 sulfurtransferase [Pseudomonadota bacterium]MBV1719037.1 sulfurtransferase [Desulfomicrobium sp.]